jgi:Spy/CpxP family protein refolding chaperone
MRALHIWLTLALTLVLAFAVTRPAAAQGRGHAAKSQEEKRARVQKRLAQVRERILKKEVGLDDAKAAAVEKIFAKYQPVRQKLVKEQREHRQAIRKLLKQNSDDQTAYKKEVSALRAVQKKLRALGEQQADELSKVLTPKQQAKLIAALQRLRRVLNRQGGGPKNGAD